MNEGEKKWRTIREKRENGRGRNWHRNVPIIFGELKKYNVRNII